MNSRYPNLMPVNPESMLAGFEIFAKFSAWIKAKFDSPNYESKHPLVRGFKKCGSFLCQKKLTVSSQETTHFARVYSHLWFLKIGPLEGPEKLQ